MVHALLIQYFNIGDVYFSLSINIFRHLKLEIALAILASNERKIEANYSAAQGVRTLYYIQMPPYILTITARGSALVVRIWRL